MTEKEKSSKGEKKNLDNIIYTLLALVVFVSILNVFIGSGLLTDITGRLAEIQEPPEPAVIEITRIDYSGCDSCFDVGQVIEQIKAGNVEVASEKTLEFPSEEAKNLIEQYPVDKLPTVIITGKVDKIPILQQFGRVTQKGGFVLTTQELPYYDVEKEEILGLVTITTILDSSCEQCADMGSVIDTFKQLGVVVTEEKTLEYGSEEAKELIERFEIKRVPVLIISESITDYQSVRQIWGQLDAVAKEGFYRLHSIVPPYRDLQTGEILGIVELINLVDSSCAECYNVAVHEQILRGFGVAPGNQTYHEIETQEAKELIEKYNITRIPTILLSPEASLYESLARVWAQVGSVEDDGWYVFRDENFMIQSGGYKDLTTGEFINQTGG